MYERNAIVLERYFNQMFGYNMKSNIKTNFKDYCDLVECLEKYKEISNEDEDIIQEYDMIANRIMEIQKRQEVLNKKNTKFQNERVEIFQVIDENSDFIQKRFDTVHSNIQEVDNQIKQNSQDFISAVAEFNEKSKIRTECGKSRRSIEKDYNKILNKTLDDYKEINAEIVEKTKQFRDISTEEIEDEIKGKIKENGEKEKIPFNMDVIKKAISLNVDIQKKETEILTSIYDKTSKLFTEIKKNNTKSEKHKKTIKDAKSKLEFIGALKEYLVQFLDNERLTAVNGEKEHNKLMKEACENLDEDIVQINNLYTLLLKEITKKTTKKSYAELYNYGYLIALENKSEEFDNEIKKLNLPVTIINPNYWRIEGMKKIYDVFNKNVTEKYGRDLSEYMPIEDVEESFEDEEDEEVEDVIDEHKDENVEIKYVKVDKRKIKTGKNKKETEEEEMKAEIDKKIDMILGFNNTESEDDFEEEDEIDDDVAKEKDDEVYYDIWGNDIKKEIDNDDEKDDEDDWEDDEDWEDEDDIDEEDNEDDADFQLDNDEDWEDEEIEDEDWEEEEDNDDEEELKDEDDWDDDIADDDFMHDNFIDDDEIEEETKTKAKKTSKSNDTEEDWGNEFINIDKKDKTKKKKSFFDKFKK